MVPPVAPMLSGNDFISQAPRPYCSTSPPVDLLVVYTPKALADIGGYAALLAQVEAEVFFANITYEKSGVGFSMRLVGVEALSYAELSNGTDLSRLQNTADGYMDEVLGLRNAAGADFVAMWVGAGAPYGGLGYVVNPTSPTAPDWTYCLISVVGTLRTLVHEVGQPL